MRFLLDQDVYELTARLLVQSGGDVLRVRDLGLSRADDVTLQAAAIARRIQKALETAELSFVRGVELSQSQSSVP